MRAIARTAGDPVAHERRQFLDRHGRPLPSFDDHRFLERLQHLQFMTAHGTVAFVAVCRGHVVGDHAADADLAAAEIVDEALGFGEDRPLGARDHDDGGAFGAERGFEILERAGGADELLAEGAWGDDSGAGCA